MDETFWAGMYERAAKPALQPVLVGFNVNIDRIIQVSRELLDSEEFCREGFAELKRHLIHSMERCTAEEWFVIDPEDYSRFTDFFSGTGNLAIGGQAGIAALHLASLGVPEVSCVSPALSRSAAEILREQGVRVPGYFPGTGSQQDDIHLIFEYRPGLVPLAGGTVPRNNRFIASPKKTALNTILPERSLLFILPKLSTCTRAFLSGYQYLQDEQEFIQAASQIRTIRKCNPHMRVHIESVSVTDPRVLAGLLHHILPAADSAGMNEHELALILDRGVLSSPASLVQGVLDLAQTTGLARIHLHTFGYYLLVRHKDQAMGVRSQTSLLYAARVVAESAGGTGTCISPRGIEAIREIENVLGQGPEPGIFTQGDYQIIAVPTQIADGVTKTAGLGDILSSTAFIADPWKTL
jgi:ADP-dependent phosphofructokinase/glucokinase